MHDGDDLFGKMVVLTVFVSIFVGLMVRSSRRDARRRKARHEAIAATFANPADFLSDSELSAELERRRQADPDGFAAAVTRNDVRAPGLAVAVLALVAQLEKEKTREASSGESFSSKLPQIGTSTHSSVNKAVIYGLSRPGFFN